MKLHYGFVCKINLKDFCVNECLCRWEKLFCLFVVLLLASCKTLTPEEKQQRDIAQTLEEFEPIFNFQKIEKENINITDRYLSARSQFLTTFIMVNT